MKNEMTKVLGDWGFTNRLNRIIKPKSGRCVMLAIDHGYFGNIPGQLKDFSNLHPLEIILLLLTKPMVSSLQRVKNQVFRVR